MIDTIVALLELEEGLDPGLFQGGIVTEVFDSDQKSVRLFKNPGNGDYAPRVTYWPGEHVGGWLKPEDGRQGRRAE